MSPTTASPPPRSEVRPLELGGGGRRVGALHAGQKGEHGVILALHGGGYDARYWHDSRHPDASLLLWGARLGFEVLALDRPGYRSSDNPPGGLSLNDQAGLLFDMMAGFMSGDDRPLFLIGHSMGAVLSIVMAASGDGGRLAGMDLSGLPLRFPDAMRAGIKGQLKKLVQSKTAYADGLDADGLRALFFGADGSFDPVRVAGMTNPTPTVELIDVERSPDMLPGLMQRITAPTRLVFAEEEKSSLCGPDVLDEARALLSGSRYCSVEIQRLSGHNISQHFVARAYHLRALAFFEECRLIAGMPAA